MNRRNNILLICAILALLGAILLMAGCNPTKRVLKDQRKVERVVKEWRKMNPLDTLSIRYLPGKDTTIIRTIVRHDSFPVPYPVRHRVVETRTVDRLVVDTSKTTVRDPAFEAMLRSDLDKCVEASNAMKFDYEARITAFKQRITDLDFSRDQWRQWALSSWLIIAVLLFLWLNRKFKIIPRILRLFSPIKF